MMISKLKKYNEAFVWIWLPGEIAPIVAGKLTARNGFFEFNYGKSYLNRENAISIYDVELPLKPGVLPLSNGLKIPNCLRDAAPDAWGRRVIINRLMGKSGSSLDVDQLDELTYLLESGTDRIGALDFQHSPTHYEPRAPVNAGLDELLESAERVEKGIPLTSELDQALLHGSSIGGARPKALIKDKEKYYIAKFSSSTDLYSVVKAEFIAMRLAKCAGLDVSPVSLTHASGKDILLVERFDRIKTKGDCQRKLILSALTLLSLDEMMARYASYQTLTEIIRAKFYLATENLKELFARLVFNILIGNTDDHARNHAAFWDGKMLSLTPAYDLCPQNRTGNEASQAMLITGNNRMSKLSVCLQAAHHFLLSKQQAESIIEFQVKSIAENWESVCDMAELNEIDRKFLAGRQFLNPFIFDGLQEVSLKLFQSIKNVQL